MIRKLQMKEKRDVLHFKYETCELFFILCYYLLTKRICAIPVAGTCIVLRKSAIFVLILTHYNVTRN